MKPLVRWTIGPTTREGFECLYLSIRSFLRFYDVEPVLCFNCDPSCLPDFAIKKHDQRAHQADSVIPKGVAWKLYPPRLAPERHELFIDNDIVFCEPIPEITHFFNSDSTLLLEGNSRTYGRFERYVPPGFQINSGIFGLPPGFNLTKYMRFYGVTTWEENATGRHAPSKTFDEQGLVATALLDYPRHLIIPETSITSCELQLSLAKGMHFIGLNRRRHQPYLDFKYAHTKTFL